MMSVKKIKVIPDGTNSCVNNLSLVLPKIKFSFTSEASVQSFCLGDN